MSRIMYCVRCNANRYHEPDQVITERQFMHEPEPDWAFSCAHRNREFGMECGHGRTLSRECNHTPTCPEPAEEKGANTTEEIWAEIAKRDNLAAASRRSSGCTAVGLLLLLLGAVVLFLLAHL